MKLDFSLINIKLYTLFKNLFETYNSNLLYDNLGINMDYLKKSLKKLNIKKDYEEVDTKLASGWYVDSFEGYKKKKYKTKKVEFKISKKTKN